MLPLIFLCFVNLLEHSVVHGHPHTQISNTSKTAISYSENPPFVFPDTVVGYLPPIEEEFSNSKHNKTIRKRSAGRAVTLPTDLAIKLKDKPISYFSTDIEANRQMILDCHNKYRRKAQPTACNMLEMRWSDEAAKTADAWAKKCIQGHSLPTARVIPKFRCGENIFLAAVKMTWDIVVDCWYSEYSDFEYGKGSTNGEIVGHYTQVMWGPSFYIGCSMAECPNLANKYNFVCHYCPTGNRKPTEYPYKSGKPCGDCPNACQDNLCRNPCLYMDDFSNCNTYMTGNTCGNDQSLINDCSAMCKCTNGEIR